MFFVVARLTMTYVLIIFSSRRRHTRCSRDWSSDVCSSDLWLCFGKQWEIRSFIPRIEKLVEDGTFKAAKISKKHSRSKSSERKECVLCVYTSDDPGEKSAVYEKLQQIGLRPKSWKSDMETLLDL